MAKKKPKALPAKATEFKPMGPIPGRDSVTGRKIRAVPGTRGFKPD